AGQGDGVAALALAQPALGGGFVQRQLDRRAQLGLLERLEQVARGVGGAGATDGLVVGVGREIDDRYAAALADAARGLDAVGVAVEADVHEHEGGGELLGHADRGGARAGDADDGVTDALELLADVARDHALVLDDQDAGSDHGVRLRACASKAMVKVVPASLLTTTLPWS